MTHNYERAQSPTAVPPLRPRGAGERRECPRGGGHTATANGREAGPGPPGGRHGRAGGQCNRFHSIFGLGPSLRPPDRRRGVRLRRLCGGPGVRGQRAYLPEAVAVCLASVPIVRSSRTVSPIALPAPVAARSIPITDFSRRAAARSAVRVLLAARFPNWASSRSASRNTLLNEPANAAPIVTVTLALPLNMIANPNSDVSERR